MSLSTIVLLVFGILLLGCAVGLAWCLKVDNEQDDRGFDDEDIPFMKTVVFILPYLAQLELLFRLLNLLINFTDFYI